MRKRLLFGLLVWLLGVCVGLAAQADLASQNMPSFFFPTPNAEPTLAPTPRPTPRPTPSPTPSPTPLPDTLSVVTEISPASMVVPEEAEVRVTLYNSATRPISDIRIMRDNGSTICEVGALSVEGDYSYLFTETLTPTDTQLSEGSIMYLARYTLGKGTPLEQAVERVLPVKIERLPAKPKLEFTRVLPVTCAKPGEELRIAYRVKNAGNVALTNVRISDELLGEVGQLERLEVGEKRSFICRYKFQKTVTSRPAVRYAYRGTRDVLEESLEPATVYLADERLDISLDADRSTVSPGAMVTLTYHIVNNGTVSYEKLRLADQTLGELAVLPSELKPGQEYVFTKTVALKNTTTFLFNISGRSAGGSEFSASSNPLTIAVDAPSDEAQVEFFATADATNLAEPGDVTFRLTVRNTGEVDRPQVKLSENTRGLFKTLAVAAPGDTVIEQKYRVSAPGVFQFVAELSDGHGDILTLFADPIEIVFSAAGRTAHPSGGAATLPVNGASYQLPDEPVTYFQMMVGALVTLSALVVLLSAIALARRRKLAKQRAKRIRSLKKRIRETPDADARQFTKPVTGRLPPVAPPPVKRARDASRKPGIPARRNQRPERKR